MDMSSALAIVPAKYLGLVLAIMGLCAALDALIPQPKPGSPWVFPRKILSLIAQNYKHAENVKKPGETPKA